jgi:Raf kinase inhibitor-like YbhB/YbcL family protein
VFARTPDAPQLIWMAEFMLASGAFTHGRPIPARHTCEGEDLSPPLAWSDTPAGARSLALITDDPDAPGETFTHWIAWGLDPEAAGLAEGEPAPVEGRNDFGAVGYRGPCPPPGHGRHRYVFRLFALGAELELGPRAARQELDQAIATHAIAVAELMGTYER